MKEKEQWTKQESMPQCSKKLGQNVCKESSEELGKKVWKKSSKELGKKYVGKVARI